MELKNLVNPHFKLTNLQMFAEGGEGGDGGEGSGVTPPAEPTVPKAHYDKLASELAGLKKQIKAKESDDEKMAREQAEKDAEINDLLQFKNKSILEKGLLTSGIDSKSVESISEAVLSGDMEKISKAFGEVFSKSLSELKKENEALKLAQIDVPNGGTNSKETTLEDFKKMTIDEQISLKNSNPELFTTLRNQLIGGK